MDPREFFRLLYGEHAADNWLALWRSDTKATTWERANSPDVAKFVDEANREKFNAYFGVCLHSKKSAKKTSRGNEESVSIVPGFWADIDFATKTTAKAKIKYPSREQAEHALTEMPFMPSLAFFTGGGIHAYWIFDEPFKVVDSDAREEIKRVSQGWQGKLKTILLKRAGAGIDSTFDLARVMRIVGTRNTKAGVTVAVDSIFPPADPVARYPLRLFTEQLTQAAAKKVEPPRKQVKKRTLATNETEPPADRLANLIDADPKFRASWANSRRDLKSPSEYDLSLATFAHNAGWDDRQIAALLVSFARRFYPTRIDKILRVNDGEQDYLERTLRAAKRKTFQAAERENAVEAIDRLVDHVETAHSEDTPADRNAVLGYVSEILGLPIVGFRQTGDRDEVYELIVIHEKRPKSVIIGGAAHLHKSPQRLIERVMAETRHHIDLSKELRSKWAGILRALLSVVQFVEVKETKISERVRALIDEHLFRFHGVIGVDNADQRSAAAIDGHPFVQDGKFYVLGRELKRLASEQDRTIGGGDLYVGLRELKFAQATVQIPSRHTSRSYWVTDAKAFGVAVESP